VIHGRANGRIEWLPLAARTGAKGNLKTCQVICVPIHRVVLHISASGGEPVPITRLDRVPAVSHRFPRVSSRWPPFPALCAGNSGKGRYLSGSLDGDKPKRLSASNTAGGVSGTGLECGGCRPERTCWVKARSPSCGGRPWSPSRSTSIVGSWLGNPFASRTQWERWNEARRLLRIGRRSSRVSRGHR